MMNHAGLDENYRRKLWCETISTATKLDNLMARKMGGKPFHFNFVNDYLRFRKHLRTFGEMAVVVQVMTERKQELKLKKEEELLCLLDMQMIILEMCTDSYISNLDKSF